MSAAFLSGLRANLLVDYGNSGEMVPVNFVVDVTERRSDELELAFDLDDNDHGTIRVFLRLSVPDLVRAALSLPDRDAT